MNVKIPDFEYCPICKVTILEEKWCKNCSPTYVFNSLESLNEMFRLLHSSLLSSNNDISSIFRHIVKLQEQMGELEHEIKKLPDYKDNVDFMRSEIARLQLYIERYPDGIAPFRSTLMAAMAGEELATRKIKQYIAEEVRRQKEEEPYKKL